MYPVNLIFDGNYLFHKTRFVTMQYRKSRGRFLDTEQEQGIFIRKVATDFVSALNSFNGYKNVIFTKDNHSWRKDFYADYKNNRHKDEDEMNWENFHKLIDEFMEILESNGIIISTIKNAEGDDLMYLWSNYFLTNKIANSIVITADRDLTQIVKLENDCFNIVYTSSSVNRKLVAPKGFNKWLNIPNPSTSIFNTSTSNIFNQDGKSLIKNVVGQMPIEELDPYYLILLKVFSGDKIDNIPSIFTYIGSTGKENRITERHVKQIYNYIIKKYGEVDIDKLLSIKIYRNNVKHELENILKKSIDTKIFEKNLERNIQLVYLNTSTIPKDIQDEFNNTVKKSDDIKTKVFDRINLLKDTRFNKNIAVVSDVFEI